ncbi:MAG: hypothetical protein KGJ13_08185 [Patescibacteria group bacterium]|nr:hypothetical protein [Patescibacteria group bacterium]
MAKKSKGVDPELEKSIQELLKTVMADSEASLTDKMKVLDRALKLEQIKQKIADENFGTGFFPEEEEDATE